MPATIHPTADCRAFDLAVIGGDGIGPEVVAEGLKVLDAVAGTGRLRTDHLRPRRRAAGSAPARCCPTRCWPSSPRPTRSCSAPSAPRPGRPMCPSGLLERGLLLKLRFAFDHYVNLRPSRLFPGVPTPLAASGDRPARTIDFVVVREGTEGLYCGNGGLVRDRHPARDRDRGEREHRVRGGAGRPGRVRARHPAPQQDHLGAQAQRAGQRRRAVEPHLQQRSPPNIPASPPTTCMSTPRRSSWSPTRHAST